MIKTVKNIHNWPRTMAGSPIFSDSGDAIFYAHLVVEDQIERLRLTSLRKRTLSQCKLMQAQDNPDLDHMMKLATKGQFYRECLEEIERIEKEGG